MDELEINVSPLDNMMSEEEVNVTIQESKESNEEAIQQEKQQVDQVTPITPEPKEETKATAMDYVKDTGTGVYLGLKDTARSIVTLPEQIIDFFSGEMSREGKDYDPEWDDWMTSKEDPIETKTWWGGLIRSTSHVASMWAVPIPGLGAKATAAKGLTAITMRGSKIAKAARIARIKAGAVKVGPQFKLLGQTKQITGATLAKSALSGAKFDALSITSLEDNVSGMLRDHVGFMDTPLATKDIDHPMMKKFKNVAEGMMLGPVVDGVFDIVGTGARYVTKGVDPKTGKTVTKEGTYRELNNNAREDSVRDQNAEMGMKAKSKPGYDAYKNKPVSERHQGNSNSLDSFESVDDGLYRTRNEWGAEDGIPGNNVTTSQVSNMARSSGEARSELKKLLKRGYSENYFKQLDETAARQNIPKEKLYARHAKLSQEIYEGRMTSEFTADEFWERATREKVKRTGTLEYEYVAPDMMHTIDHVNGVLLGEIRSLGVLGRELENIYDLRDSQGPAAQLVDKLIAGLRIRAIQRAEISQQFRDLDARAAAGERIGRKQIDQMVDERVQQSIDAFRIALAIAPEDGGDDLFKAIFEVASSTESIRTLDDLDQFMRIKMRGGSFKGKPKTTGALIKELGSMFTHSVLSGPKTAVRAVMGTSSATFARPMAMAIGGAMKGDFIAARQGLASLNAMREAIPESFQLFKTRLNGYWSGQLTGKNTRFFEKTRGDDTWDMYGHWAETRGNQKDKMIYRMANLARGANDSRFLTYSTKLMQATDDAFGLIIGRARAREKAFIKATEALPDGDFVNFDEKFFKNMEDYFDTQIFDSEGNLQDAMAAYTKREATLTQELNGFAQHLDSAFKEAPWARPFFLFARTGINGLNLTAKHTPGLNLLVKEYRDIAFAKPGGDLSGLKAYGINNAQDLMTAKAVQNGRMAMGGIAISMASMAYLGGGLHGNGPTDRKKRQSWMDMGWKPRTVKIGSQWVSYDAFEPYNQILALIGDVGDHMDLMGEEWAEDNFLKLAAAMASTVTSKSYMAGLQSFVDLFSGAPGQQNRIIASLMNNTLPLSSLRNEIGKVLNPYTKELGSDIWSSIRNRNQITEGLAADGGLPTKYDILNGRPIKDHDFVTRMFNAVSPVQFNLDYTPGRQMLFNSGFDLRVVGYSSPTGIDLSQAPEIRSLFQKAIGDQNLEAKFDKLATQRNMQVSIAQMNYHKRNGMKWKDPKDYPHYKIIAKEFDRVKRRAWAKINQDPKIQRLIREELERTKKNYKSNQEVINKILKVRS